MITSCWIAKDADNGRVKAIFTDWDDALDYASACQFLNEHPVDLDEYDCSESTLCKGCVGSEGYGTQPCLLCLACRAFVNYTNKQETKGNEK